MEMSFFALPSKQVPAQGRFKPAHLPISLSTKVAACVRRLETPTHLNDGRPALALSFRSCVWIRAYLTSRLSLLMPYKPACPDIAKWHVKVKMLFIIDQLQVLFDDMFGHACDNVDIVNVVIVLIHGLDSMVIFKVVIYGFL